MPVGDVVGAYRAAPSMAFQSALSQFFGGDGFNYSPEEIIQRTYERNLEALRETRAGEIAKAQLGVQQATNPAVAKAAADVQGKAYEFLGNAVAQSLKNPAFTSPAARAEVARAF